MSKSKIAKEFERCWNDNWEQGYAINERIFPNRVGQIKHLMHTAFVAGIQFAKKEGKV